MNLVRTVLPEPYFLYRLVVEMSEQVLLTSRKGITKFSFTLCTKIRKFHLGTRTTSNTIIILTRNNYFF